MTIGIRLRQWRKENNLTTTEVHTKTGISTGALSNYENDKREVGSDFLLKLREIYNADIYYILTGVKSPEITKEEIDILNSYRKTGNETKDIICKILNVERTEQEISLSSRTG